MLSATVLFLRTSLSVLGEDVEKAPAETAREWGEGEAVGTYLSDMPAAIHSVYTPLCARLHVSLWYLC